MYMYVYMYLSIIDVAQLKFLHRKDSVRGVWGVRCIETRVGVLHGHTASRAEEVGRQSPRRAAVWLPDR